MRRTGLFASIQEGLRAFRGLMLKNAGGEGSEGCGPALGGEPAVFVEGDALGFGLSLVSIEGEAGGPVPGRTVRRSPKLSIGDFDSQIAGHAPGLSVALVAVVFTVGKAPAARSREKG